MFLVILIFILIIANLVYLDLIASALVSGEYDRHIQNSFETLGEQLSVAFREISVNIDSCNTNDDCAALFEKKNFSCNDLIKEKNPPLIKEIKEKEVPTCENYICTCR